jgi:hypothetical protein
MWLFVFQITFVLGILRLSGLVPLDLIWVFSPIIVFGSLYAFCLGSYVVGSVICSYFEKKEK